jgi:hypothetical protein
MNCFNHPDKPAIGFCKSCCKGLCPDCAAVLPNGLACRNACEGRVVLINGLIDDHPKVVSAANRQVRASGLFILLLGTVLMLFGFVPMLISGNTGTLFMGIIGLFFAVYGVLRLMKKSQYYPTGK